MSDTAQEGYLALGLQTAQGTPATTTPHGLLVTSNDVSGQTENIVGDPEIGRGRDIDSDAVDLGTFNVSGSAEAYVRFGQLGYLLLALGFEELADPVQDGVTGAYEHTFTPSTSGPSFLTLESAWGRNRAIRRFSDVVLNELGLSVSGNEAATMSLDFLGLAEEWRASASAPTYPTPDPRATYLGSRVVLDGLGSYRFTETEVTIANNASDDEAVLGQRTMVDTTMGGREVTGSGTIRLDGSAPAQVTELYRAAMYGSKTATAPQGSEPYHTSATVTIGSPKLIGTSTTHRYGLDIVMPDVVVNAFPLEGSGADVIEASIEWQAFAGDDPIATLVLRNARATKYVTP